MAGRNHPPQARFHGAPRRRPGDLRRRHVPATPEGDVRAKGLLDLADSPGRATVLQSVGRRHTFTEGRPWGAEPAGSRLVVIGVAGSLDRDALDAVIALAREA